MSSSVKKLTITLVLCLGTTSIFSERLWASEVGFGINDLSIESQKKLLDTSGSSLYRFIATFLSGVTGFFTPDNQTAVDVKNSLPRQVSPLSPSARPGDESRANDARRSFVNKFKSLFLYTGGKVATRMSTLGRYERLAFDVNNSYDFGSFPGPSESTDSALKGERIVAVYEVRPGPSVSKSYFKKKYGSSFLDELDPWGEARLGRARLTPKLVSKADGVDTPRRPVFQDSPERTHDGSVLESTSIKVRARLVRNAEISPWERDAATAQASDFKEAKSLASEIAVGDSAGVMSVIARPYPGKKRLAWTKVATPPVTINGRTKIQVYRQYDGILSNPRGLGILASVDSRWQWSSLYLERDKRLEMSLGWRDRQTVYRIGADKNISGARDGGGRPDLSLAASVSSTI